MNDPLSLVPFAMAAGGGQLDGFEAGALVAAGITLLQRSAPVVRALAGRTSATVGLSGHRLLCALAASDGRAAVLLAADESPAGIAAACDRWNVGAVFTVAALTARVPAHLAVVLLDDAPRTARVRTPDREQTVDLGSHHGLELIGDTATVGSEEPWVILASGGERPELLTHRTVLAEARAIVTSQGLTPVHSTQVQQPVWQHGGLIAGLVAPLLAGGQVSDRSLPAPDV